MLFELLIGASCLASCVGANGDKASLVVYNAKVWTGDPDRPGAERFAVRDGRFVIVGGPETATEIEAITTESTIVIDAGGRRVLPGLIDAHVHLEGAASDMRHLDLRGAASREHLLEMLREYAANFDPDAWVIGTRWSAESWPDQRPPTAAEIDDAVSGRKALLVRMDGHSLLASAAALDYCNITRESPPDPAGGAIGRSEDGEPTGALFEQAQALVMSRVTLPPADTSLLLRRAVAQANEWGLTQVGAIESRSTIEVLAELDRAGELPIRVQATVRGGGDTVAAWEPLLAWADASRSLSSRVRVTGFKGVMDGTLGSRTAWMTEPYLDNHLALDKSPDNAGFPLAMAGTGALAELIRAGAAKGLQPAVHAIGDRSNHVVLDWFESLDADVRVRLRPRIEHAQHLLPEDVERFTRLNVVPSMQPYHKADDGRYAEQRLGPRRVQTSYAFRSLLDSGALLAFGSDWPVMSGDPFLGIHAAVTAETLDGEVFVPQQAISVVEAIECYTVNAAKCLLNESETGSIRVGLRADFVVLDRDILAIRHEALREVEVVRTVVDGVTVFERQ
jgi:predicted amidohydrolase YtcJ